MKESEKQLLDIIETLDMNKCTITSSTNDKFVITSKPFKVGWFRQGKYVIRGEYDEDNELISITIALYHTDGISGTFLCEDSLYFEVNDLEAIERIRQNVNGLVEFDLLDKVKEIFC